MKVFPAVTLAMLAALAMTACTADYARNGSGPLLLLITAINSGNHLDSDVVFGEQSTPPLSFICPDVVAVRVENKPKNPNITSLDYRGDIVIERYEVSYFRSDGRGVEGVDVPYTISGNLASEVIFLEATTVNIEVVRRQAKLEPPLINLFGGGSGAPVLTVFAQITLHGRTTIGQAVTATGRLQIDFADFGDKLTSCPTT